MICFIVAIILACIIVFLIIKRFNKPDKFEETEEFKKLCFEILDSKDNFFITGKAGTGKSMFISYLVKKRKERGRQNKSVILLAPTGIAALNIKGQTIHSFFRFPTSGNSKKSNTVFLDRQNINFFPKRELLENIDMIIIDEISMVSSNMLRAIDYVLKTALCNDKRFGGIQMILIGDFHQLPPVVIGEITQTQIKEKYGSYYFFNAFNKDYTKFACDESGTKTFSNFVLERFKIRELTRNFRQSKDNKYLEMVNKIRNLTLDVKDYAQLNNNCAKQNIISSAIILVTRNDTANDINKKNLENLKGKTGYSEGNITFHCDKNRMDELKREMKNFEKFWGTHKTLKLKERAKVMMIINDPAGKYQNGTRGVITKLKGKISGDRFIITALTVAIEKNEGTKEVEIRKEHLEHYAFIFNKDTGKNERIKEVDFCQFPLKLAWAITIHKSQGLTFKSANIDFEKGAFCHGQAYVAFSRISSFSGLNLLKEVNDNLLFAVKDNRIIDFENYIQDIKKIK